MQNENDQRERRYGMERRWIKTDYKGNEKRSGAERRNTNQPSEGDDPFDEAGTTGMKKMIR